MPYANTYRPDRLYLPQEKLLAFAANHPTPFYLYDEAGIRKSARTVFGSFCRLPEHRAFFPLRANGCPAILTLLRSEGFGALAQSVPELLAAERCGFSADRLMFHSPALTREAIFHVRRLSCGVSFDAPEQLAAMADELPHICFLRYHPDKPYMKSIFTNNSERNKCGMSRQQIITSAAKLCALGRPEIGLHCHLAGNSRHESFYPAAVSLLLELAAEVEAKTSAHVIRIDPGGGIGIPYKPREAMINLPKSGALLRALYENRTQPTLYTELGRAVIGRHGMLVSRVVEVRERTRRYVVLDASANALPRLILQRHEQRMSIVGCCAKSGRQVYSVHGCSSDLFDRFNDRIILPPCTPGQLIALRNAGAYCESVQMGVCVPPQSSYLYTLDGEFVPTASAEALRPR